MIETAVKKASVVACRLPLSIAILLSSIASKLLLRDPVALDMSEQRKPRKRSKFKRWLRSWVFMPLGNVKIKLINKVERKRYQSISDSELKRIVFDALTDRYPTRYFRHRSNASSSSRTSLFSNEYILSVVDLGIPNSPKRKKRQPERSVGRRKENFHCMANRRQKVTLAVATLQPHQHIDPRRSWRGELNGSSVLRVMNPDLPSYPVSEEKGLETSNINFTFGSKRIAYELPVIVVTDPDLHSELISEKKVIEHPGITGRVSRLVIGDVAPQIPGLYFIDRPDPPLSCLITQALRTSSSSVLSEPGICSCSSTVHSPNTKNQYISQMTTAMSQSSITHGQLPKSAKGNATNRVHRKRNAFQINRAKGSEAGVQPPPSTICKDGTAFLEKINNSPLPALPVDASHDAPVPAPLPYNLHYKLQHGALPALPSLVSTDSPGIASTCVSSYEPETPIDIPPDGDRSPPLYRGWRETQAKRRALHSHPYQPSGTTSLETETSLLPYPR